MWCDSTCVNADDATCELTECVIECEELTECLDCVANGNCGWCVATS